MIPCTAWNKPRQCQAGPPVQRATGKPLPKTAYPCSRLRKSSKSASHWHSTAHAALAAGGRGCVSAWGRVARLVCAPAGVPGD
eukprot:scaffold4095_cov255-Prasinococcus_capsulatus_cf.AAC.1